MNTNICEDCSKITSGRCWRHQSETVVFGSPAYTHSVFVDEGANIKTALQKLVDKLETIEKDDYVRNLHKYVFSLWKNELVEAKKVLEESNKPPVVLCTTPKDVDLFDVKQLELDEYAKKLFKATHGVNLLDDSLKDENEM